MASLDTAVSNLIKNKNIDENFAIYNTELKSLYKENAAIQLSMNYFTLCQIIADFDNLNSDAQQIIDELQALVKAIIIDNNYKTEAIDSFRSKVIEILETLTAYMDRFQLYEYILNRIEFKFNEGEYTHYYYNNEFEDAIKAYVLKDKDNSIISAKMSEIIGQLPMRLSKNKFFDILLNTFSLYKGSEKSSVKDFSYMIETCGGIYPINTSYKDFELLCKANEKFASYDYENLTKEDFDILNEEYYMWSTYLEDYSNLYMMVIEVVNSLYSISLCNVDDTEIISELNKSISATYAAINCGEDIDVSIELGFEKLEGKQEQLATRIYHPEAALVDIESANYEYLCKNGLTTVIDELKRLSKLQSSSSFAKLENEDGDSDLADEIYVGKVANELIKKFADVFSNTSTMTKRAIMSSILQNIPIFFNSFDEFTKYVHISLTQCTDEAERQACMTLINSFFEEL